MHTWAHTNKVKWISCICASFPWSLGHPNTKVNYASVFIRANGFMIYYCVCSQMYGDLCSSIWRWHCAVQYPDMKHKSRNGAQGLKWVFFFSRLGAQKKPLPHFAMLHFLQQPPHFISCATFWGSRGRPDGRARTMHWDWYYFPSPHALSLCLFPVFPFSIQLSLSNKSRNSHHTPNKKRKSQIIKKNKLSATFWSGSACTVDCVCWKQWNLEVTVILCSHDKPTLINFLRLMYWLKYEVRSSWS